MHSLMHNMRAEVLTSPPPTPSGQAMETNLTASRQARRFLADRVRNDWDYPDLPAPWDASDEEVRSVRSFRERSYGTPSESDEAEASVVHSSAAADGSGKTKVTAQTMTKAKSDPYKFDSPDSIGLVIAAKADERARRRREALEEELKWNEGLQIFEKRRDAWTGAASVRKYGGAAKRAQQEVHNSLTTDPHDSDESKADSANALSSPVEAKADGASYFADSHTPDQRLYEREGETLLPVPPRLLADNPVRQSITSKIYPDVFNKVVVQNRTPSVPINLSDMTKALVEGWKKNDEWPPKPGPIDPLAGGRKKSIVKSIGATKGDETFLANHPHVRRGVESVKKVFRISGSHSGSSNFSPAPQD